MRHTHTVLLLMNDAFVMKAWKENLKVEDEVLLLSDGNGDFTKAIGAELDLSDKPIGLGVRSRRYAILAEDGIVKVLNLEEGGSFTFSSAEDMLKALCVMVIGCWWLLFKGGVT
ncbi:Peroxiredoxin-2E-1 [Ranunculus cassubicifolius]